MNVCFVHILTKKVFLLDILPISSFSKRIIFVSFATYMTTDSYSSVVKEETFQL